MEECSKDLQGDLKANGVETKEVIAMALIQKLP